MASRMDAGVLPMAANMARRCAAMRAASVAVARRVSSMVQSIGDLAGAQPTALPRGTKGSGSRMISLMRVAGKISLAMNASLLKPGMRLGVGVSGGADSVALLRALHERSGELGLVLSVAHLHHGLRGAEADGDLEFVRELAAGLGLP